MIRSVTFVLTILSALIPTRVVLGEHDCLKASDLVKQGVRISNASEEELGFYQQALGLCPDMAEAVFNIGIVLQKQGKVVEAERYLRQALSIKNDPRFRVALGSLFQQEKKYDLAKEHYQAALVADEKPPLAYQGMAKVLQDEGKVQEAVSLLEDAKKSLPLDTVTALNLGVLYEVAHRYEDAGREYLRATTLDSTNAKAFYLRGMLESRSGNLAEARPALERAVALDESYVEAILGLAEVNEKMNRSVQAQLGYRRVLKIHPDNMLAREHLIALLLDDHAYQEAVEILKVTVALDPKSPKLWSSYGRAQMELGQVFDAENSFKRSLELDSGNARVHNNLGVLYHRLGKIDKARAQLQEAMRLDPAIEDIGENLEMLQ